MNLLMFLPGLIGGALAYIWVYAYQEAHKHKTAIGREFVAICLIPLELTVKKEKSKEKVFNLLEKRHKLMYSTMRKEIKLSSAVLNACIEELKEEGKITEAGRSEHAVFYQLRGE